MCGDGKHNFGSSTVNCDDQNTVDGDGCSKDCLVESLWVCAGGSPTTKDVCTDICGDGKLAKRIGTNCDDSNQVDGDGCSMNCVVETGWTCTGGTTTTKDTCTEICGDGKVFFPSASYCDDGNNVGNDGCTSCAVDAGWTCTPGSSTVASVCTEICGDGKKMTTDVTKCDDNNQVPGDGCDGNCKVEAYFECTGGTTTSKDT